MEVPKSRHQRTSSKTRYERLNVHPILRSTSICIYDLLPLIIPLFFLLTCKLDYLQLIGQFYIKVQVCTLFIFHAIFNPITQYKIKLIYKYTFQIIRKGIRNYNFCTINISTKTSQELINLLYKISGKNHS